MLTRTFLKILQLFYRICNYFTKFSLKFAQNRLQFFFKFFLKFLNLFLNLLRLYKFYSIFFKKNFFNENVQFYIIFIMPQFLISASSTSMCMSPLPGSNICPMFTRTLEIPNTPLGPPVNKYWLRQSFVQSVVLCNIKQPIY